ncbi:hypothetical protein AB0P12_27320 [Streptomyces subrutilus]
MPGGDDPRGPGTPTVAVDGTRVPEKLFGRLFERESFDRLLQSTRS